MISIVIPCYNSSETISKCLDSIINSGKKYEGEYEIILVDDGSTDQTLNILQKYKRANIKIITEKHIGPGAARNLGVETCTGEFITFVDSDDYVAENYFDEIFNFDLNKYDLVIFNYYQVNAKKSSFELKNYYYNFTKKRELFDLNTSVWNKIFKKELIKKNGIIFFRDSIIGEDLFFLSKYISSIDLKKICFLDSRIYIHCDNTSGIIYSQNLDSKLNLCKLFATLEKDIAVVYSNFYLGLMIIHLVFYAYDDANFVNYKSKVNSEIKKFVLITLNKYNIDEILYLFKDEYQKKFNFFIRHNSLIYFIKFNLLKKIKFIIRSYIKKI